MIKRDIYLEKLIAFKDKKLIKIITGVRRCGKSTIFELFQDHLRETGVSKKQIQTINFEDIDFEELTDYKKLHDHLLTNLVSDKKNYIFLDEIQNVPNFQKAVDSLFLKKNIDIYLTGSNAYMLSAEIATLLSGRYIEIKMLPLSFKEYLSADNTAVNLNKKYRDYLTQSSFPYVLELNHKEKLIREYLSGIYNTVVLKDVVSRHNIADVSILESVIKFMFDNIGNISSIKKISDTLISSGRKITPPTVENYLKALTDSFILYRIGRYDVKGKQYLKTGEKYYVVDIGLRYFLLGTKHADYGHILENIVFLELYRRGYQISIGKIGDIEVDFVAVKGKNIEYIQVAQSVLDEKTLARELAPLKKINDHFPKILLTLDEWPANNYDGITQMNALDWLLNV